MYRRKHPSQEIKARNVVYALTIGLLNLFIELIKLLLHISSCPPFTIVSFRTSNVTPALDLTHVVLRSLPPAFQVTPVPIDRVFEFPFLSAL